MLWDLLRFWYIWRLDYFALSQKNVGMFLFVGCCNTLYYLQVINITSLCHNFLNFMFEHIYSGIAILKVLILLYCDISCICRQVVKSLIVLGWSNDKNQTGLCGRNSFVWNWLAKMSSFIKISIYLAIIYFLSKSITLKLTILFSHCLLPNTFQPLHFNT